MFVIESGFFSKARDIWRPWLYSHILNYQKLKLWFKIMKNCKRLPPTPFKKFLWNYKWSADQCLRTAVLYNIITFKCVYKQSKKKFLSPLSEIYQNAFICVQDNNAPLCAVAVNAFKMFHLSFCFSENMLSAPFQNEVYR